MSSEALAFSLVTEINHAMARLVDIWDSIGIMEDQRVERMQTVKKHIDVSYTFAYIPFFHYLGFKLALNYSCSLGAFAFHDHGGRGLKTSHQS